MQNTTVKSIAGILAGKHGSHKIALAKNVWADLFLWHNKEWVTLPWAFPGFRDGKPFPIFAKMMVEYKS